MLRFGLECAEDDISPNGQNWKELKNLSPRQNEEILDTIGGLAGEYEGDANLGVVIYFTGD